VLATAFADVARGAGRPQAKYAPWFGVVLKCARLAVNVLSTLSEEVRARGALLGVGFGLAIVCAQACRISACS